jgi:intracellular sulfur oxidation DsrE/DsrF family protein
MNMQIGVLLALAGILVLAMALGSAGVVGQESIKRYRAVLDVTGAGEEQWQGALNNVENLRKAFGENPIQVEVVVHGKALQMLVAKRGEMDQAGAPNHEGGARGDHPPLYTRLKSLTDAGVIFAACENTMQRQQVSKEDLLPFARTVDSAMAELVRKQTEGWAYIKPG